MVPLALYFDQPESEHVPFVSLLIRTFYILCLLQMYTTPSSTFVATFACAWWIPPF